MQSACAVLSSVACLALSYLFTFSHEQHDFWEKKNIIGHKMCFDFLYNIFGNISYSEKNSAKCYHNVNKSSCKVPVILVKLSWKLHFLNKFSSKNVVRKFNQNSFS